MNWVRDTTGRFSRRPYYQQAELDLEAERLLNEFHTQFYGQVLIPVPTGAPLKLIDATAMILTSTQT